MPLLTGDGERRTERHQRQYRMYVRVACGEMGPDVRQPSDGSGGANRAPPADAQSPPRLGGWRDGDWCVRSNRSEAPGAVGYNSRSRHCTPSGTTCGAFGMGRQRPPRAYHVVRRRRLSGSDARHPAACRSTGMAPCRPACRREETDRVSGIAGSFVKRCRATSVRRAVSRIRRCVVTQRSGCLGGRVPPHEEEPRERES